MENKKMETMYDFYCSQPECLKQILDNRKGIVGKFGAFYAEKKPDRVYLVGSGSSKNANNAAQAFMSHVLGTDVLVVIPSSPPVIRGKNPLIIVTSQGGKSTNTFALIQDMRQKGYPIVTFTGSLDEPIPQAADLAIDVSVGDETVGPKTRGYTGTVLCLYLAALEGGLASGALSQADYDKYIAFLDETIGYGAENQEKCLAFYNTHLEALKEARDFQFLGKGCAAAVGAEDALKVVETIFYPSTGHEFEEFLHGPTGAIAETSALFFFYTGDEDGPRMENIAKIIRENTAKNTYIIDRTSTLEGEFVLSLKSGKCKYMSPFVDVFFGQLISALLPGAMGKVRHPGLKELAGKTGTKIQG